MKPFWKYPWPYRTRTNNAKICVEPQKTNKQKQIAKAILRKKKNKADGIRLLDFRLLQSYKNQNSMFNSVA